MAEPSEPPALEVSHVVHLVLLPMLVFAEFLAYYAGRTQAFSTFIGQRGLEYESFFLWYSAAHWGGLVATLFGGVLAATAGPYAALMFGTLVGAGGSLMCAWGHPAGLVLVAMGVGLLRPALWTIAAMQLVGRLHGRASFFAVLYVMLNLGAALSAFVAVPWVNEVTPVYAMCMVGLLGLVPLVGGLWMSMGREQVWPEPAMDGLLPAAGASLAIALLVAPVWGAASVSMVAVGPILQGAVGMEWIYGVNVMLVVPGGLLAALAYGALQWNRVTVVPATLIGVGLLATSLGTLLAFPAVGGVLGIGSVAASVVGLGLAEIAIVPATFAHLSAGLHWRLVPIAFAVYSAASTLSGDVGSMVAEYSPEVAVGGFAFVIGASGVIVLLAAIGLRRELLGFESPAA